LPGDAEQALGHYQRSLEVSERLLAANPESAQAARDVLVSLERQATVESKRTGGAEAALALQRRSLELACKLQERNPDSYFHRRTAAVSFWRTAQFAQAAGNQELASKCLTGCFAVLDSLVQAGVELDPAMRQLHALLKAMVTVTKSPETP
jgi:hypothetical protein